MNKGKDNYIKNLNLIKERKKAELTQKELGLILGYTEKTAENAIYQFESGRRELPARKGKYLAKLFNCNMLDLYPEEEG